MNKDKKLYIKKGKEKKKKRKRKERNTELQKYYTQKNRAARKKGKKRKKKTRLTISQENVIQQLVLVKLSLRNATRKSKAKQKHADYAFFYFPPFFSRTKRRLKRENKNKCRRNNNRSYIEAEINSKLHANKNIEKSENISEKAMQI